jgi:hypothetical protein
MILKIPSLAQKVPKPQTKYTPKLHNLSILLMNRQKQNTSRTVFTVYSSKNKTKEKSLNNKDPEKPRKTL